MDTVTRHCTFRRRWKTPAGTRSRSAKTPPSWKRTAMDKYDLLIVNADRRDDEFKFTLGQQEAIFDYVRSGHGYVSIHGADNAAKDWLPAWKEMLGGIFSHFGLPDGKTRKGSFIVKIADTSSPITAGLEGFQAHRRAVLPNADDARRTAAGDDRISRNRLAGGLDPQFRQRPRVPHRPGSS